MAKFRNSIDRSVLTDFPWKSSNFRETDEKSGSTHTCAPSSYIDYSKHYRNITNRTTTSPPENGQAKHNYKTASQFISKSEYKKLLDFLHYLT